MALGLRNRLILFLVATVVLVQGLTMVILYEVAHTSLVNTGKRQLILSAAALSGHVDALADHLAQDGKVLSLDQGLRQAVASGALAAAPSLLADYGKRVGAARVMLVRPDGVIAADTLPPGRTPRADGAFPWPALLRQAEQAGAAQTNAILDGAAYRVVMTPILAPTPIAWLCLLVNLDKRFAEELRALSPLRKGVTLVGVTAPAATPPRWSVIASAGEAMDPLVGVRAPGVAQPTTPELVAKPSGDYLVLTQPLPTDQASPPLMAVLQFPLDEALQPYHRVMIYVGALMAAALVVALLGMVLIARSVTRPLQALAGVAKSIAQGTYALPPPARGTDEIAQLSSALASMVGAIAEREDRIRHHARHDAVTGLPNRLSLEETLGRILEPLATAPTARQSAEGEGPADESVTDGNAPLGALLVVGIDRLGEITNTLGHEVADCIIADVGFRLCRVLPAASRDTPAAGGVRAGVHRLSDNSFALLAPGVDEGAVKELAREILSHFDTPYTDHTVTVDVAVQVGIALYPRHGTTAGALLRRADVALFAARKRDPHIHVYDAAHDPHRADRLSLMSEMREAVEQDLMGMAFQPKLDLHQRQVMGTEALVRWVHPKRGFIPPDSFIPLAEETGAIRHLTRWAIRYALRHVAVWRYGGRPGPTSAWRSTCRCATWPIPACPTGSRTSCATTGWGCPPSAWR